VEDITDAVGFMVTRSAQPGEIGIAVVSSLATKNSVVGMNSGAQLAGIAGFTDVGQVVFRVDYRYQVAQFTIEDTGVGIHRSDLERIFLPFERARMARAKAVLTEAGIVAAAGAAPALRATAPAVGAVTPCSERAI